MNYLFKDVNFRELFGEKLWDNSGTLMFSMNHLDRIFYTRLSIDKYLNHPLYRCIECSIIYNGKDKKIFELIVSDDNDMPVDVRYDKEEIDLNFIKMIEKQIKNL